jgi:hypothetical protein
MDVVFGWRETAANTALQAGSGVAGRVGRLLISPFMPSTAMMLERIEAKLAEHGGNGQG